MLFWEDMITLLVCLKYYYFFVVIGTTERVPGVHREGPWYVSNVSIIFDCSMLLYYLFWLFPGFTLHFYIIFGTNLLTGGPSHIVIFLPISVFRRKGISNGVQTEWNLRKSYFWKESNTGDLECTSGDQRGEHEAGGAPTPQVHPSPSWGPRCSTNVLLPPIYTYIPRKHPGTQRNTISTAVTFCIREISSWSLHRHSVGGGINHGGLLHQHPCPSDELWVVYHRPTGP